MGRHFDDYDIDDDRQHRKKQRDRQQMRAPKREYVPTAPAPRPRLTFTPSGNDDVRPGEPGTVKSVSTERGYCYIGLDDGGICFCFAEKIKDATLSPELVGKRVNVTHKPSNRNPNERFALSLWLAEEMQTVQGGTQ